jgi:hypothetical protein
MRGKERFSAPRNSLDSIMRFSAGNARALLYGLYRLEETRFVSGHDFSRAVIVKTLRALAPEGCFSYNPPGFFRSLLGRNISGSNKSRKRGQ